MYTALGFNRMCFFEFPNCLSTPNKFIIFIIWTSTPFAYVIIHHLLLSMFLTVSSHILISLYVCLCLSCDDLYLPKHLILLGGGTRWRSWLRHCATSRKVAGSIPDGVIGIFH